VLELFGHGKRSDYDAESQRPVHEGEDGQGVLRRPRGKARIEEAEVILREDGIDPRGLEDRRVEQAAVEERDSTQALGLLIRAGREEALRWRRATRRI
jgi:hypothetical protein